MCGRNNRNRTVFFWRFLPARRVIFSPPLKWPWRHPYTVHHTRCWVLLANADWRRRRACASGVWRRKWHTLFCWFGNHDLIFSWWRRIHLGAPHQCSRMIIQDGRIVDYSYSGLRYERFFTPPPKTCWKVCQKLLSWPAASLINKSPRGATTWHLCTMWNYECVRLWTIVLTNKVRHY